MLRHLLACFRLCLCLDHREKSLHLENLLENLLGRDLGKMSDQMFRVLCSFSWGRRECHTITRARHKQQIEKKA
jgi:hypothetical protein